MVIVSAPGKLMLLGEHAVVYNRPCLVTAVGQRMRATVELVKEPIFQLEAPDIQVSGYQKPLSEVGKGDLYKGAQFVEIAVKNFLEKYGLNQGIKVTTKSEFSSQFGFGSSSASTVCVLKALSELTGKQLDNKTLFDMAYKTVLDIQGKGSGFDVAAAIYGGTLYFVTGGKMIEPLLVKSLPLVVGYTGVKADTVTLIKQVAEKKAANSEAVERVFNAIATLVEQAKIAIGQEDWPLLGKLMNFDQEYLRDLGVSSDKLEALISAAKANGAWGAKLSGAGGGDCMIALVPDEKRTAVAQAMKTAGGEPIQVEVNTQGVRLENNG